MAESRHVTRFRKVFAFLQLFLLVPASLLLLLTVVLFEVRTVYEDIISRYTYFFSAYIIIITSILSLPLSIFGALVSIRHKVPAVLSTLYIALLCILFIGQMTGSCLGFLNYGTLRQYVGQSFQDSISNYNSLNSTKDSIDATQSDLQCCGGFNFTDWNAYIPNDSFPASCCHGNTANATCTTPRNTTLATISNRTMQYVNELPCADAIARAVIGQTYAVGYVGLLGLFVPGVLIVVTFCLVNINLSLD